MPTPDTRQFTLIGASAGKVRAAKYGDRDHIVIPVVALVGDVIIEALGSNGPEFVPGNVVERSTPTWSDEPVVMDHPIADDGRLLSAKEPTRLAESSFGRVFFPRYADGRLHVEAWLDESRAAAMGASDTIARMKAGETVEVSIGANVTIEKRDGMHGGKPYSAVWTSIVPDHLAIGLRGAKGACSVEMGCGAPRSARYQVTNDGGLAPQEDAMQVDPEPAVRGAFSRLIERLQAALNPEETETTGAEQRAACSCQENHDSGETKGDRMAENAATKERVKALIDNPRSPFKAVDEVLLLSASEERLAEWEATFAAVADPTPEPQPVPVAETPIPVPAPVPEPVAVAARRNNQITDDELARMRAALRREEQRDADHKADLVANLRGAQSRFNEARLNTMTIEQLEDVAALVGVQSPEVDYSLSRVPRAAAAVESIEPPDTWGIAKKLAAQRGVN